MRDGVLICSGHPNTILRTDRHYENFVVQFDWMHLEPGGNSGFYVWTNAELSPRGLPKGVEIQILDLDWVRLNTREGQPPPPIAYVHGEFIPVGIDIRAGQPARRAQHGAREPGQGATASGTPTPSSRSTA